jgi:cytochrome c55X
MLSTPSPCWPVAQVVELRRVLLAIAASAPAATGAAGATPDADRQAELLHQLRHDCGSCHGITMAGGLGPALLPAQLAGRGDEELARIVLDGVPRTPMPAWRTLLTEDEALWLVQRLKEGLDEE